MKLEEYEALFAGIKPETAPADYQKILTGIREDLTTRDTALAKNAEDAQKIRDLQDTNHKLFLSQMTHGNQDEEYDDAEGIEGLDAWCEHILKEANKK